MSHPHSTPQTPSPSALSPLDQALLRLAGRIVPTPDRPDWHRSWQAELWHKRNQTRRAPFRPTARGQTPWPTADLAPGLLRDALWLRVESWNRVLRGTAPLCLAQLLGLCLLATGMGLALYGGPHPLAARLAELLPRITLAAVLVIFVTFSVGRGRPLRQPSTANPLLWLRRQLFLAAKLLLLLLTTFLLSTDLTAPLTTPYPLTADFLQSLSFVLLALVALRWAATDQEGRCKDCLRTLSAPARVGRPSRNLLEWNGTELACTRGHGRLTIPELETSWCQRSAWVVQQRLEAGPAI